MKQIQSAVFLCLLSLTFPGQCEKAKNSSLTYSVRPKAGHFVLVDSKDGVARVVAYRKYLSLYYDNNVGDVCVLDLELNQGVYIPHNVSDKTLKALRENYEEYLENSVSLKELYSIGVKEGYQFDVIDVSPNISKRVSYILGHLSEDYASDCKGVGTAFEIDKGTCDYLATTLVDFDKVLGDTKTKIRSDLKLIIEVSKGFVLFFKNFPNGTEELYKKQIKIKLDKLLNMETGCEILAYFLKTLSSEFDLGKILGRTLNSRLDFLKLASYLGGRRKTGFEGLVDVVYEISKYNNGKNSKLNLNVHLEEFFKLRKNDSNLVQKWDTARKQLIGTLQQTKLAEDFKGLTEFLNEVDQNKWIDNGVNMTKVFGILVQGPKSQESVQKILELVGKKKEHDCKCDDD